MTGDVKIQVGMSGGDHQPDPFDIKVWLNGQELRGLCALQVNIEAQKFPTVTFTIEPATIEFEGLVELKRVFAPCESCGTTDPDNHGELCSR